MSEHGSAQGTAGQVPPATTAGTLIDGRFDKFTERLHQVFTLAQDEAQRLDYAAIGTEHLLLGLLDEGEGVAAQALITLVGDLDRVRAVVLDAIGRGQQPAGGVLGLTPQAKKVLTLAAEEAKSFKHRYIGTEHLLLGLLREGEGIAAAALASLGVTLDQARAQVLQILATLPPDKQPPKGNVVMCRLNDRTLAALDVLIEAGVRTTRSDAAAWLIQAGIAAQSDLFASVSATVAEIRRLREVAQTLARRAVVHPGAALPWLEEPSAGEAGLPPALPAP